MQLSRYASSKCRIFTKSQFLPYRSQEDIHFHAYITNRALICMFKSYPRILVGYCGTTWPISTAVVQWLDMNSSTHPC
uniref:Uncharacterized protein n=1 Tax=Anguilla anguilla TaxID=7936 RepID=A0A0E9WGA4_ANGAN